MPRKKKKIVLVVGWDGATWKIIKPLLRKNKLPFLKRMIQSGASGLLESSIPPVTAPAWASFQTGANPGQHGIYDFSNWAEDVSGNTLNSSSDIKLPRFWDILENEGKKFCIVNLPLTYPPPKKKNGIIIASFLTPPGKSYVSDRLLGKELEDLGYKVDLEFERYGVFPKGKELKKRKKELYKEILEIAEKRFKASLLLAGKRDWDFFFVLFKSTDLVQHLFWDSAETREFYIKLDQYLEGLYRYFESRGKEVELLVISDHGFHKKASYQFALNTWLKGRVVEDQKSPISNVQLLRKLYSVAKRLGVRKDKFTLIKLIARKRLEREREELVAFRKSNTAWANHFGIFINREKVPDYEKLRSSLISQLKSLSFRGVKVFSEVWRREDLYWGKELEGCPDILFLPNEKFYIDTTSFNPQLFIKRETHLAADHYADRRGIFVACGPSFAKRRDIKPKIWQTTPLLLRLLGIDPPFYMEEPELLARGQDESLEKKIEEAKRITKESFKRYKGKVGIAWTGGKDSTVLLHLIKEATAGKLPPAVFIDHKFHFKETYDFAEEIKQKWGLDVVFITPQRSVDKIKKTKSDKKRREYIRIAKIEGIDQAIKGQGWKALFVGIRRDENPARSGEKEFSRRKDHTRIHPILHFKERDIWAYIRKYRLPYNPLYDRGYRSLDERKFTKKVENPLLPERWGREKDKEKIMERLRALGYF